LRDYATSAAAARRTTTAAANNQIIHCIIKIDRYGSAKNHIVGNLGN
jgi:hypothetical protein